MDSDNKYRYKWWALLGLSLLAFTAYLDFTIVNTALPFIQTALNATLFELQWIPNIFTIILSMTMIAVGKIADLLGRKKVFYFGVVAFALGALGAGFSENMKILIAFRAIQAIGASIVFVTSAALLTDVFPENERVKAISIYGGITGFGLLMGPFLGGVLIAMLDWRWVFWINIPLIAVGIAACSFSLQGTSHNESNSKLDWLGLVLLIVGLGNLMYGIVEGAETDWTSHLAWWLLGLGVIALLLLVIYNENKSDPLLDFHIFTKKIIALAALSCAMAGVASTVFMFFDPLYLKTVRDLPPFQIGLLIAIIPAAQAFISFGFNRAVNWLGTANLLFISITAAFFAIVLHRFIHSQTPLLYLSLPFFLLGVNWGLSNSAMITAINEVIPVNKISEAYGTIATIWNIVGSVMLACSAAVFHAARTDHAFMEPFHRMVDFNMLFAFFVLLIASGIRWRLQIAKKDQA